ncbi:YoaK family protein [Streptomyces sp. SL13]|uniref:YoaK family protein n=1 Tax=Streptantibioticus silvisoli TaxID=2705255 RepID=A0AA90KHK4_9ACTN|nr:YoaK family protein [Streptantibioticus silvisoli]MDI5971955.1 YoaK family protein [Streptantibioticus silvisoli]
MPHPRRPGREHPGTAGQAAVVLLAAASGAVDALAFTALGHVFAGVMTGNLALLGIALGGDRFADVVPPVLALAGFTAGTAAAARVCRVRTAARTPPGARWPVRTLACLACEAALLTCAAAVWAGCGAPPGGALRDVLLCAVAAAMGVQTGAMLGAGPAARPSTYLTGTLATFITRGVTGPPDDGGPGADRWVPVRLAALVVGAGAASAVLRGAPVAAAFLPPALVAAALLTALRPGGGRRVRTAASPGGA